MAYQDIANHEKIINPLLARAALKDVDPHGEFMAYFRMAKKAKHPAYLKDVQNFAPGFIKALIPCDQIETAVDDRNILSIELREHINA